MFVSPYVEVSRSFAKPNGDECETETEKLSVRVANQGMGFAAGKQCE